MTETAIVTKIEGSLVYLNCTSAEHCASCGAKGLCKSASRPFPATNNSGADLAAGDHVRYELPQGRTISLTFMIFLFPLLLFILCYAGGKKLYPDMSEGLRILISVAGLAAGFMSPLLYGKYHPVHPVIIEKL
ncbi:MAG: SoxR reducing system RseC family protein [Spirochaetales bacterium]|nr:SoxR reducing system RseC family protein [Spirochaetales bacterium]